MDQINCCSNNKKRRPRSRLGPVCLFGFYFVVVLFFVVWNTMTIFWIFGPSAESKDSTVITGITGLNVRVDSPGRAHAMFSADPADLRSIPAQVGSLCFLSIYLSILPVINSRCEVSAVWWLNYQMSCWRHTTLYRRHASRCHDTPVNTASGRELTKLYTLF